MSKSAYAQYEALSLALFINHSLQRPTGGKLVGSGAIRLVQSFLEDALSGEKRRLGFVFLYELLRGDLRLKLLPNDAPALAPAGVSTVGSAGAPSPTEWACGVCTVINDGGSLMCLCCGTPNAAAPASR